MSQPIKKIGTMKKAWLVQWGYYSQNEDECLKQSGIEEKIVDVISVRKSFNKVTEIAKNIYKCTMLSFSEKFFLSNYSNGEKRKKEFFSGAAPVFTHHQSDLYRSLRENTKSRLDNKKKQKLIERWKKYPEYITVGYNPYLEIRKVFNLSVYRDDNGNELIEWEWPLPGGGFKKEKYSFKR